LRRPARGGRPAPAWAPLLINLLGATYGKAQSGQIGVCSYKLDVERTGIEHGVEIGRLTLGEPWVEGGAPATCTFGAGDLEYAMSCSGLDLSAAEGSAHYALTPEGRECPTSL